MKHKAVIVGAGALGLGFLAERLADSYDLFLVDVGAKRRLLSMIHEHQGYSVNLCRLDRVYAKRLAGTFTVLCTDDPADGNAVDAILREADLVLTATSHRVLANLVARIAPAMNARQSRGWLLFCENGPHIAADYAGHFASHVVRVNTVMSRMCRFSDTPERGYVPLWPGYDSALVVEDYDLLPLDAQVCASGPFSSAFSLVSHEEFLCWRDIKLFLHNGMHAFVSYRAFLEGARFFPETSSWIRDQARQTILEEVLPAIMHAHARASREEIEQYGLGLLERFFNPFFNDSVERGVRDTPAKLAPDDRLVGGCRFIEQAGIKPVHYAGTVEAALRVQEMVERANVRTER